MSTSTVALTIEMPSLDASLSWNALESLVVGMSHEVPARALALALDDAQERLLQEACGPRWAPVRGLLAPFACPGCGAREDFARKGKRTRPRKLHTAAGTVELILWHVGCRGCGRNFAPLLVILGLSGKRRTDRLSLDLAELGTQMSFARAGRVDAELAGTSATAGQAHNAMADVAALLTGGHEPEPDDDQPVADEPHEPDEPDADRPEDDQPAVADGEAAITVLAQRLWPAAPIQRCWWHLPHGLRKAFYADDAANRHVNPRWARTMAGELAELLREQIRGEHTTEQALADWDAFSARLPAALTSAHAYLNAARPHAFTCLDPDPVSYTHLTLPTIYSV